jgi:hypothetical protein
MQPNSMAMKVRFLTEGEDLPGLVKLGEIALENGVIEVPEFARVKKIQNGVTVYPEVPATFEIRRNVKTRKYLIDWHEKKEKHDVTIIYTDADGTEYERQLWQDVELRKLTRPEVDFSSVSYAKMDVIFLPYEIKSVDSQ